MDEDNRRLDRIVIWGLIRDVIARADELVAEATNLAEQKKSETAPFPPSPGAAKNADGAGDRAKGAGGPPPVYVGRRRALREALIDKLKPALEDRVGPRQTYHAILALTSYIDERERTALGDLARSWTLPFLQTELVQIDDGGDRFYDTVDDLLLRPDTFALVYEIFFLCLRCGFVGRLKGKPELMAEYSKRLELSIHRDGGSRPRTLRPTEPVLHGAARGVRKVSFVSFPYRDYAVALGVTSAVFVVMRLVAHHTVVASHVGAACNATEAPDRGTSHGAD